MSLRCFLKFGQRTILSSLPEIRASSSFIVAANKNFHSLCDVHSKTNSKLLETAQRSSNDVTRGMKTKGRLQLRCKGCYIVRRQGRAYVMCKTHPRHKQQIIVKDEKNTWILTTASQGIRPW